MKALLEFFLQASADEETPEQKLALIQAVRREIHAGNAMQGLLAGMTAPGNNDVDGPSLVKAAVVAADALIAELDKPQA